MIPNETIQTIQTTGIGVEVIGNFDFADDTKARIMQSLSDKMYTRKELAVIREYSNNANDAHIVEGKPTSEMVVTLPTMIDLTFKVRDFGAGLSRDEIANVYCILGRSTKRNSAEQNGTLGYGCKSGFAAADSFTVTSWNKGEKAIYNCIKGDSQTLNKVIELSRCPTDEPNGIEVCIPVKQTSLWIFHSEASNFFKFWENLPTILNMTEHEVESMMKFRNTAPTLIGEGWNMRPKSDGSAIGVAYMGGVGYRIDWNVLNSRMALDSKSRVLFDLLQNNDVVLTYKMGEVQFVDSREGLEYTDLTINALTTRIKTIFEKITESIQDKFTNTKSLWEAKIVYNAIFGTGLLELEKGENADCIDKIKILDGNLISLESSFKGTFKWNDVVLDNSSFDCINRFDNNEPDAIGSKFTEPLSPVMKTYRRKGDRTKFKRCGVVHNDIVASHQVAVVLDDIDVKSSHSSAARYLIFNDKSVIKTVHILNFVNDTIRSNFYKELDFHTVPVIKLSDIIADVKGWMSANKGTRNTSVGSVGSRDARQLEYMDIESGTLEVNSVSLRDLTGKVIYIKQASSNGRRRRSRRNQVVLSDAYSVAYINGVMENIKTLVEESDLDIDKVYIVDNKTFNSKWFLKAKESGNWICVWKYITDNISLDNASVVDSKNYNAMKEIAPAIAEILKDKIVDENSPILKKIDTINTFKSNSKIAKCISELYLWQSVIGDSKGNVNFASLELEVDTRYPFLDNNVLSYGTTAELETTITYINAMDAYINSEKYKFTVDICFEQTEELVTN